MTSFFTRGWARGFFFQYGFDRLAFCGGLMLAASPPLVPAALAADDGATVPTYEVTVEGEALTEGTPPGHDDYLMNRGWSGAKMDIPAAEVPQAITQLPARLLEEQNNLYMNDAVRNVAGAQPMYSAVSDAPIFKIRGFQARNIYRDGLRDETYDRSYWLGDIDHIDILKGPASVMYGDGNLGGTLNFVSKRPLEETGGQVAGWGGSNRTSGLSFDGSARISDDGQTRMRAIADQSYSNTYVDSTPLWLRHLALLAETRLSPDTTLFLKAEDRERTSGIDSGLPVWGTVMGTAADIPRSANYNTAWSRRTERAQSAAALLDHRIDDTWSLHSGLAVNYYAFDQDLSIIRGYNGTRTQLTRTAQRSKSPTWQTTNDTSLEAKNRLLGLANRFVAGTEFGYSYVTRTQYTGTLANVSIASGGSDRATGAGYALSSDLSMRQWRAGQYVQDQIELAPGLKVMAGLRLDTTGRHMTDRATVTDQSKTDQAFSQRAGITYEVVDGVTLYGGYSRAFSPPGSTVSLGAVGGRLFDPETGQGFEAGVKTDIGERLTTTAAIYQLRRQNVITTDPATNLSDTTGEQKSRGFELDAALKITDGWNLFASYAYTDARVTKDQRYLVGSRVDNVPLNAARLWSVWEAQSGPLKGVGFGGGVTYVGERPGVLTTQASPQSTYILPQYATVDLTAYYKLDPLVFRINATNILDRHYYEAGSSSTVYSGQPATVIGRVSVGF